jgi:hypothetical protein
LVTLKAAEAASGPLGRKLGCPHVLLANCQRLTFAQKLICSDMHVSSDQQTFYQWCLVINLDDPPQYSLVYDTKHQAVELLWLHCDVSVKGFNRGGCPYHECHDLAKSSMYARLRKYLRNCFKRSRPVVDSLCSFSILIYAPLKMHFKVSLRQCSTAEEFLLNLAHVDLSTSSSCWRTTLL